VYETQKSRFSLLVCLRAVFCYSDW